jgi:transposase-like protein
MEPLNRKIQPSDLDEINSINYWPFKDKFNDLDQLKIVTLTLEEEAHVSCGHCGSKKYVKNGRYNDLQRYRCKLCGRNFNQLTGTPLAGLRKKGRWLKFSECLSKGYSVRKSATLVGVDKKTSFKWRHRFLKNAYDLKASKLNGISETTTTSFKYSEKGAKVIKNPHRFGEEVYVMTSLDRNRFVTTPKIEYLETERLRNFASQLYASDSLYVIDGKELFVKFAQEEKLNLVNVTKKQKANYKHINNALVYNDHLHNWMKRFRGVATKYLDNYLSWFRQQEEFLMKIPVKIMLVRAKSIDRFPYRPMQL